MTAVASRVDSAPPTPSTIARRKGLDVAFNVGLFAVLWSAYSVVRTNVGDTSSAALDNARSLLEFQQRLGIDVEASLQAVVNWPAVHVAANAYYLLHFPLTIFVLGVAFRTARADVFPAIRNGLMGCTAFAVVVHWLVPMAPPRMLPGFIDSSAVYGPDPYAVAGSESANQFAAMPSMHVAWAIVVGLAARRLTSRAPIRTLALIHPVVTTFVVIVTGHHFVTDVAVGAAVAVAALLLPRHSPKALAPNMHFADSSIDLVGVDAFEANLHHVHEQLPGAVYSRTSEVNRHNGHHRSHWAIHLDGELVLAGFDVAIVNAEARVVKVIGFFGPLDPSSTAS